MKKNDLVELEDGRVVLSQKTLKVGAGGRRWKSTSKYIQILVRHQNYNAPLARHVTDCKISD